jgi:cellulose synthase/poly-beta-1,6-N-acetylglucosamine synthase-like glycosyltransferase
VIKNQGKKFCQEILATHFSIVFTITIALVLIFILIYEIFQKIQELKYYDASLRFTFVIIVLFFLYGTLVYLICRLGYWQRRLNFSKILPEELDVFLQGQSLPKVTYLIPSYKEDLRVIRQTLLSAALQAYPHKEVVLLIDNPPLPQSQEDRNLLIATRQLCQELEAQLRPMQQMINQEYQRFLRIENPGEEYLIQEGEIISKLLSKTAQWFQELADHYQPQDHSEVLMVEKFFLAYYRSLGESAQQFKTKLQAKTIHRGDIQSLYQKLASIFQVKISSFERKVYENLSHKRNKAMNINTYLDLMGKRLHRKLQNCGLYLVEDSQGEILIPDADYLVILDADSIILPQYTKTLTYFMECPEGQIHAVAQTPYCAYPNPSSFLERITAASTDVQHFIHQGSTFYGATFWVGANAMVRKKL